MTDYIDCIPVISQSYGVQVLGMIGRHSVVILLLWWYYGVAVYGQEDGGWRVDKRIYF